MSIKSEKDDLKLLPRFKEAVCETCDSKEYCIAKDDHWYIMCPKFFNFKTVGYPVIRLHDYSYNVEKPKDLR